MENPEVEIKARNSVPVQITVLRGKNLKGSKIDSPVSYIRADYNNIHLGDSGVVQGAEGEIEYNFTTNFDCTFDGIQGLDNLVHKPVLLTVIEVFHKEKKKKDEKTVILGQATVDLLPLVQGECMFSKIVTIHPLGGAPLEQTASDEIKALLEVTVSVLEPLLSEAQLEASNLLRITAESAYSVPESWNPTGPQFNYIVSLFLPGVTQKVIFSNGILKAAGEKELIVRPKRWPISNIVAFGAQNIPDSFIEVSPYEDEDGELNNKEDWAFRTEAENLKKRVTWNIERRCFMEPEALSSLQKHIADTTYLPVEVKRVPLAAPTKGGKSSKTDKAEDEGPISFHGIAHVNMAPLLYPGVRRIRGAYPIVAYNEAEIFEKNSLNVKSLITEHEFEHEASNSLNVEGDQYAETRTYIVLEFSLTKPLVQKRLREDLAQRIAEMIPPRPLFPRRTSGADKAVTDYHNQIISVARVIMDEYQEMFGQKLLEGKLSNEFQDQEECKQKLIFELNTSGKYFAFKEQLKHAVVKIVREKYLQTVAFEDREQLQTFLNELYIYLVDQMHCCLHKMLHVDPPDPIPESFLSSAQLKHFAKEAEAGKNFELAKKYHLERLARDKSNPDHWFDYGTFYLLLNDYVKAEECFREAIAVDQEHINSLILCGTVACMNEYYKEANNFFESARCFEPNSILAWTMHGLFYESQDQTILAEMAFSEAKKLQMATETLKKSLDEVIVDKAKITKVPETEPKEDKKDPQTASVQSELVISDDISARSIATPEEMSTNAIPKSDSSTSQKRKKSIDEESKQSNDPIDSPLITKQQEPVPTPVTKKPPKGTITQFTRSIYMQTAMFLLEVNALQFVSRALAHELICSESGLSCEYHVVLARLHMQQGEFGKAEECLAEAERINHQNPDLWALLGHLSYMKEDYVKAKELYARTLSYVNDAFDMHAICLRLGSMYLLENQIESLNELTDAEDALSEANILCNFNAEVWGYLTLVCLKTGRKLEAEQTYKYASKLNLEDKQLLDEIHQLQQTVGFGNPSL